MKGRLQDSDVNGLISKFNEAIEAKYRMMHSAKAKKASEATRKRARELKDQENKETKGTFMLPLWLMNNECDIFLKFSFRCLFCHRIRHG
jgi:hypothetical protein